MITLDYSIIDERLARKLCKGRELAVDLEHLQSRLPNAQFVAVTGSHGKTWTCLAIENALRHFEKKVVQVGHASDDGFGLSPSEALSELDAWFDKDLYIVSELAWHEVRFLTSFSPDVSVITNITHSPPPELGSRQAVLDSKWPLAAAAKNVAVYPADGMFDALGSSLSCRSLRFCAGQPTSANAQVALFRNELSFVSRPENGLGQTQEIRARDCMYHGNSLVASAAALHALSNGWSQQEIVSALETIPRVPNRLEIVANHDGIDYINDGKSTDIGATLHAVKKCQSPIILVCGGEERGEKYLPLSEHQQSIAAIVCFGENRNCVMKDVTGSIKEVHCSEELQGAIEIAWGLRHLGRTLLFSPGTTSKDQYQNYRERGEHFRMLISKYLFLSETNE